MKVTINFNKRDLELIKGFLNLSYDNFHEGIDPLILTKDEVRREKAQLVRIRAAFKPLFEAKA